MASKPTPLERELLAVYRDAEHYLLLAATRQVAKTAKAQQDTAAGLAAVRAAAAQTVAALNRATPGLIVAAIRAAAKRGGLAAVAAFGARVGPRSVDVLEAVNTPALDVLAATAVGRVQAAHSSILRTVPDAYRRAVARATPAVLVGAETRLEASQRAWWELTQQGITGFVDKAGRRWRLSTYVEMATRTAVNRAEIDGKHSVWAASGHDLVQVVGANDRCPKCRPWHAAVLSISGSQSGEVQVEHATRDGEMITVRVTPLEAARAAGWQHPQCFPGGVLVSAPTGVTTSYARRYEGELVVIHTASGNQLPVTPNHPVLTPEGWVEAGALQVGDSVLRYGASDERVPAPPTGPRPRDERVPTAIREVHEALRQASGVTAVRVPSAAEQFHGDGEGSEVEVVLADRLLGDRVGTEQAHGLTDGQLFVGGAGFRPLVVPGTGFEGVERDGASARGHVGGCGVGLTLLGGHGGHTPPHDRARVGLAAMGFEVPGDSGPVAAELGRDGDLGTAFVVEPDGFRDPVGHGADTSGGLFGSAHEPSCPESDVDGRRAYPQFGGQFGDGFPVAIPRNDGVDVDVEPAPVALFRVTEGHTGVEQSLADGGGIELDGGRELLERLSGRVTADEVVHVERTWWSGHVYNLGTVGGWYVASEIVVHNCRCGTRRWMPGVSKPDRLAPTTTGYEARQQQRAIERGIRAAKEKVDTALDPAAAKDARVNVRAHQERMREHLDANPQLLRYREREQIGAGNIPHPTRRAELAAEKWADIPVLDRDPDAASRRAKEAHARRRAADSLRRARVERLRMESEQARRAAELAAREDDGH